MYVPHHKNIILCCLIGFFCSINMMLWAQSSTNSVIAPSETTLAAIVQQLQNQNKHQRLKIAGILSGFFTKKDQIDYVFWLNEQETSSANQKRQLVKLTWQDNDWRIATIAWLPAGVAIDKGNFIDVTGDDVLDFLYNYSYANETCIDGCAVLSLQDSVVWELYSKKEERSCQSLKWSLYQKNAELPFVNYKLIVPDTSQQEKTKLLLCRFVKKYNGGQNNKDVLEQAQIDSSSLLLEYDIFSNSFFEPLEIACNAPDPQKSILDPRHPALRLALHYLNRNGIKEFDLEGVYQATTSQVGQIDYLFYSTVFSTPRDEVQKRKLVKISCDGHAWKIKGLLYVSAYFSPQNIKDVDGDGIDEIIDENVKRMETKCIFSYRILSFKGTIGKSIYTHKNNYTFCDTTNGLDLNKAGMVLGQEYSIEFKDIDEDGLNEIVQSSSKGVVSYKYDLKKERFLPLPSSH